MTQTEFEVLIVASSAAILLEKNQVVLSLKFGMRSAEINTAFSDE